jgi:hypothetical protein
MGLRTPPWKNLLLTILRRRPRPTQSCSASKEEKEEEERTDFQATYICGHFKIICRRIAGSCMKLHLYPSSLALLADSSIQEFGKGLIHSHITIAIKHLSAALAHLQFNWPTLIPPQEHMVA